MIKFILFLSLILSFTALKAQIRFALLAAADFTLSVQNMTQTAPNKLEWDVYLLDTDPAQPLELSSFQLGWLINSNICIGGTLSLTYSNAGSGLVASQQLTAAPSIAAIVAGYPGQTLIRQAGKIPPGAGNGTIISTTGPGTLLTHYTLTSTVSFTSESTPNFVFNPSTAITPLYATRVAAYFGVTNTQLVVTPGTNAIICASCNPVFNCTGAPPVAYTVTGSGSYCQGDGGLAVGLTGSQFGVDYIITPGGQILAGTGSAITFGNRSAGTYTVIGRPNGSIPSICSNTQMAGSAVITETPLVTPIFEALGPYNLNATPGALLPTSLNGITGTWSPATINTAIVGTIVYTFTPATGQCATSATMSIVVNPVTVAVSAVWNGSVSSDWFTSANWTTPGGSVLGATTAITIPGGVLPNYLTLTAPASCANITIEDGGSFIGSEYLTVGTSTVKRGVAVDLKYHYLSSPVSGATFGNVFSGSFTTWAKKWNPLTNAWVWQTSLNPFEVGAGYAVTTTTSSMVANFTGPLNKVSATSTLSNANGGWNLLGNPFQSAIYWNDVVKGPGVSAAVSVWAGSNYVVWNGTSGTGGFTGYIPAENGFFVSTTLNNDFLTIPLSARHHSAVPFYKESIANSLQLEANGNNATDYMLVNFNNNATAGYDKQFDARKLSGEAYAPQLYSVISNDVLAINELPMAGNETISLGFSCNADGAYSFTATGMESFDAYTPILLEDTKLNTTQDLRTLPVYNFNYAAGENANRFKLHFKSTNGINDPSNSGISVYSSDHNVMINNSTSFAGEVFVYDLTGRLLIHSNIDSRMKTGIPLQAAIGAYIVKVVTAGESVNRKVFLR